MFNVNLHVRIRCKNDSSPKTEYEDSFAPFWRRTTCFTYAKSAALVASSVGIRNDAVSDKISYRTLQDKPPLQWLNLWACYCWPTVRTRYAFVANVGPSVVRPVVIYQKTKQDGPTKNTIRKLAPLSPLPHSDPFQTPYSSALWRYILQWHFVREGYSDTFYRWLDWRLMVVAN